MKKPFPLSLIALAIVLLGAGAYTLNRGFDAKDQVRAELVAQNITTPDDATIPNARVDDAATAESMADIIGVHALEATGGKTYAELDRDDPARATAFNAAALRTSLYTSVMAINVANLVVGIGAMLLVLAFAIGGLGVALAGLAVPAFAKRLHVSPIVAEQPAV